MIIRRGLPFWATLCMVAVSTAYDRVTVNLIRLNSRLFVQRRFISCALRIGTGSRLRCTTASVVFFTIQVGLCIYITV